MFKNGKRIWSLLSSSWCHWSASSLNVLSPFVLCRVFQIVFDGCVFCRVIVVHRHSYVGDFDVMLYCSRHMLYILIWNWILLVCFMKFCFFWHDIIQIYKYILPFCIFLFITFMLSHLFTALFYPNFFHNSHAQPQVGRIFNFSYDFG